MCDKRAASGGVTTSIGAVTIYLVEPALKKAPAVSEYRLGERKWLKKKKNLG